MRVSSTRKAPAFRPIVITITVETEEERDALLFYTCRPAQTSLLARPAPYEAPPEACAKVMRNLMNTLDAHLVDPTPDENC